MIVAEIYPPIRKRIPSHILQKNMRHFPALQYAKGAMPSLSSCFDAIHCPRRGPDLTACESGETTPLSLNAIDTLRNAMADGINGKRIHLGIGNGMIFSASNAPALAYETYRKLQQLSISSDKPAILTAVDQVNTLIGQDLARAIARSPTEQPLSPVSRLACQSVLVRAWRGLQQRAMTSGQSCFWVMAQKVFTRCNSLVTNQPASRRFQPDRAGDAGGGDLTLARRGDLRGPRLLL